MMLAADMVLMREPTAQEAGSFLADVFAQATHRLDLFQSLADFFDGVAKGRGESLIASFSRHGNAMIAMMH
jgi:hypothetical protein